MKCITFKKKYEEGKDGLKDIVTLTDDSEYESEKEEKETDKKPDKKEPPQKPTEDSVKKLSELVNKEETDMNRELFQKHFNFEKPSALLRELCHIKNKKIKS